jgi:short-subunit dehydrogenase
LHRLHDAQKFAGESIDVGALDKLPAVVHRLSAKYGTPDLLLLSAGTAVNAPFLDTPPALFDDIMQINLAGSREMIRAVLPAMCERGAGQIAMISSMAGLHGIYGYGAYSASKFAVTGLAQVLRQELAGSGVSVHLVCPPEVDTPMIAAESAVAVQQTRFLKNLMGTLPPDLAARRIVRGIRRQKALIVPGYRASITAGIARVFPALFDASCTLLLRWRFP